MPYVFRTYLSWSDQFLSRHCQSYDEYWWWKLSGMWQICVLSSLNATNDLLPQQTFVLLFNEHWVLLHHFVPYLESFSLENLGWGWKFTLCCPLFIITKSSQKEASAFTMTIKLAGQGALISGCTLESSSPVVQPCGHSKICGFTLFPFA